MSFANQRIKRATVTVVVLLSLVAAYVSYLHGLEVALRYGEEMATAPLLPLTIDGLLFASGMVLLYCAKNDLRRPLLAQVALTLGITALITVNVVSGFDGGAQGAAVAAAPALALVLGYELLMWLVRADSPRERASEPGEVGRLVSRDGPAVDHESASRSRREFDTAREFGSPVEPSTDQVIDTRDSSEPGREPARRRPRPPADQTEREQAVINAVNQLDGPTVNQTVNQVIADANGDAPSASTVKRVIKSMLDDGSQLVQSGRTLTVANSDNEKQSRGGTEVNDE